VTSAASTALIKTCICIELNFNVDSKLEQYGYIEHAVDWRVRQTASQSALLQLAQCLINIRVEEVGE